MVGNGRGTTLFSAMAGCKLYILHLDLQYDKTFAIDSRSTIALDIQTNFFAYQQSDKAYGINGGSEVLLARLNRRCHHCDGLAHAQERVARLSRVRVARRWAVDRWAIESYVVSEFRLALSWSKTRLHIERSDVRMSSSKRSSYKRQCVVAKSPSHIVLTLCPCIDLSIAIVQKDLWCGDAFPRSLIRTCPQLDECVL